VATDDRTGVFQAIMTHKRIEHFSGSESIYSAQSMLAPPPYTSQTSLDQMQKGQNANYINGEKHSQNNTIEIENGEKYGDKIPKEARSGGLR
jgi:hypothetical protein